MIYDVIVIGGGHAGIEAAVMSSRIGASVAIVTFSSDDIGVMSCNPAMGGLGKGHLIREIDAMGGIIGRASDLSGIQFRMLNKTRGPAVQGPRAQIDRNKYKKYVRELINEESISIIEDEVINILTEIGTHEESVLGIETVKEGSIKCKSLIVTTGTFLSGKIYKGNETWDAGRYGSKSSKKLANFFKQKKFKTFRLKTGTPPRLIGSSIDYNACIPQEGDKSPEPFSFLNDTININQKLCFITHTNEKTHKIIGDNIEESPIYDGSIKSRGPRYCPSIEDKVKRFSKRDRHQIFLEPETEDGKVVYPNGISTSLPEKFQTKFLKTIQGLEKVVVDKFGYAVEYDCISSDEIDQTYECLKVKGLFLAGQINGTTGYEEAAAQGLVAGINAANRIKDKKKIIIKRSQAYLGVLSSDLNRGGLVEPYRMFTSRAEYRLFLRADNADERLSDLAISLGTAEKERKMLWIKKKNLIRKAQEKLEKLNASPQTYLKSGLKINLDGKKRSAYEILGYKEASWDLLESIWPDLKKMNLDSKIKKQIQTNSFYKKYTKRQLDEINELNQEESLILNKKINYEACSGLSNEIKEILKKHRPKSIGEARVLPGMTPAAASILLRFVKN